MKENALLTGTTEGHSPWAAATISNCAKGATRPPGPRRAGIRCSGWGLDHGKAHPDRGCQWGLHCATFWVTEEPGMCSDKHQDKKVTNAHRRANIF